MWEYGLGIPDELFVRGDVPMTKEEIRVISLSKLRLKRDSILWDVGAGTGSVSVESALVCDKGHIYAIEKDEKALSLLEKNRKAFEINNLTIVRGEAPGAFRGLPAPNRIFIGGSGDKTEEVLKQASRRLVVGGIIVINSITLDTVFIAKNFFDDLSWDIEITHVNIAVSKKAVSKTLMLARNPVYILTAVKF